MLQFRFEAEVIHWRGPSPFFFAPIPAYHSEEIRRVSKLVTYGWGVIPVEAQIGGVVFRTSLFPKDEIYLLPLKVDVRRKTNITAGDPVCVDMTIRPAQR
ncbi:DUF1905 domain-containing protein [Mesorhizobium sp. CN2-181]|uniref:DUF1905 domain-containing protein n=1 Tax=Mesorhizobium yinganensis TaxID=3157707 RepID=UPI0032B8283A